MNVLLVGGGGREHAIAKKIRENPAVTALYCVPGNGGIAEIATCAPIKATEIEAIADFAVKKQIDFAIVAPDDPLCMGLVDLLAGKGIPAFGPRKNAAIIEGSKAFAKDLMRRYQIPTASFETFDDVQKALSFLKTAPLPAVVKADGLALGKGVLICKTREEACDAVRSMMEGNRFGAAGARVVIEECLEGPEVSVLCFTDGETIRPMVSSMDHKRALEGDEGLNTGGMGVIAPNPYYTADIAQRCMREIFLPTIHAMKAEGRTFQGCLYFGLMLTRQGPKVIEYNCRFGDPETQAVLPLMQSDLLTVMRATVDGTLDDTEARFSDEASCCVVLASGGYPEKYQTGYPIMGIDKAEEAATVDHAGTKRLADGTLVTAGGRVLGVTAVASTLKEAVQKAYMAADRITFEHRHLRRDIGKSALNA